MITTPIVLKQWAKRVSVLILATSIIGTVTAMVTKTSVKMAMTILICRQAAVLVAMLLP